MDKIFLKNGFDFLGMVNIPKKRIIKSKSILLLGNQVDWYGKATDSTGKINFKDGAGNIKAENLMLDYYQMLKTCILKERKIQIVTDAYGKEYFVNILENIKEHLPKRKKYLVNIIINEIKVVKDSSEYLPLLEEIKAKMKFDCIIMNPPFKLHLPILEKSIQLLKNDNSICVNLSPARWLLDPLADYKKKSDYKTYKNSIVFYISNLFEINAETAQEYFGSGQYEDLAIYVLSNKGGWVRPNYVKMQNLFERVNVPTYRGEYKSLYDVRSKEGKADYSRPFVRISPLHGHVGCKDWVDILSPQVEVALVKPDKTSSCDTTINEDSESNVKNLFNYLHTTFIKACNFNVKTNMRVPGYAIPYLGDVENPRTHRIGYESDWTNEDLCKFFRVTGFLGDYKAKRGTGWAETLETMEPYLDKKIEIVD